MSKLIYIPLEELEQRYTPMMNAALRPHIDIELYPEGYDAGHIEVGEFLDVNKTCYFKALQLKMIAELFHWGVVESGDRFLIGDLFFPGIEMIRYMADLQGIDVKLFGFNYAGRSDPADFVQSLGAWADTSELGYHRLCDAVFVGSEFHAEQILKHFGPSLVPDLCVTGYVWDRAWVESVHAQGTEKKEPFVIWPHRICSEKGWGDLCRYAERTEKRIVVTSCGPLTPRPAPSNVEFRGDLTKAEYYTILDRAQWYLSTAYQETFGYTIQEAIHYRCAILAPDRASYPEMLPTTSLYRDIEEIDEAFDERNPIPSLSFTEKWDGNAGIISKICRS